MNQSLNQSQAKAVCHKDGPALVLAGPGSGKTTVIINRILYLIREYGISPDQILVVTFSRAAANEMATRFHASLSPNERNHMPVTFGTLHSVFYRILRQSSQYADMQILTESQKCEIFKTILEKHNIDTSAKPDLPEQIAGEISRMKNSCASPDEFICETISPALFRKILADYQKELGWRRLFDFDDILSSCYTLFRSDPDALAAWQKRYRYILVDEFQDINRIQYQTLALLAGPKGNLFAVGDDDQSIYGFRGSDPKILRQFLNDFRSAKRITLQINYRSRSSIFNKALQQISLNQNRIPKNIRANRKSTGTHFQIRNMPSRNEEFNMILGEIKQQLKNGAAPSSIAVLFRSIFDASLLLQKLTMSGIPFCVQEKPENVFASPLASDILAYLRAASRNCAKKDILRIMNKPSRYISRDALNSISASATGCKDGPAPYLKEMRRFYRNNRRMLYNIKKFEEDLHIIDGAAPQTAIQFILYGIGYASVIRQASTEQQRDMEEFQNELRALEESAAQFSSIPAWLSFIDRYSEQMAQPVSRSASKAEHEGIQIMTMHASKGLEFDTVFVPCLESGVMPHRKAVTKEAIEEERRLLYVAMTRAKELLILSHSELVRNKHVPASMFLDSFF